MLVSFRTSGWVLGAAAALLKAEHLVSAITLTECEIRTAQVRELEANISTRRAVSEWLAQQLAREVQEQNYRSIKH
jgi:CRP-like cAMP-binding protein